MTGNLNEKQKLTGEMKPIQVVHVSHGGTSDHNALTNRSAADQHPMAAITGLETALNGKLPKTELDSAIETALAQAKESGEFDGAGMDVTGAEVGQIVKIAAVNENGVPTAWEPVDMPGGGDYVSYTEQELTEDQKHQARKNQGLYYSERESIFQGEVTFTGDTASGLPWLSTGMEPLYDGDTFELKLQPFGQTYTGIAVGGKQDMFTYEHTVDFGGVFKLSYGNLQRTASEAMSVDDTTQTVSITRIAVTGIPREYLEEAIELPPTEDNEDKYLYSDGYGWYGRSLPQYSLPQASADALGGVKADPAEENDTQPVRIGADGKLVTAPGGCGNFRKINSVTLAETAGRITISEDSDGNPIESLGLSEVYAMAYNVMTETVKGQFIFLTNGGWGVTDPYIMSPYQSNLVSTGYGTASVFHIIRIDENTVQVHTPWGPYISSANTGFRRNRGSSTNYRALKSFAIVAGQNDVFSVGTTLTIYGR